MFPSLGTAIIDGMPLLIKIGARQIVISGTAVSPAERLRVSPARGLVLAWS
jgi:hypothetical protein